MDEKGYVLSTPGAAPALVRGASWNEKVVFEGQDGGVY